MPHATLHLLPGVDENKTQSLNESNISFSNLIRFIYDRQGLGLVQKLGGWAKFFPSSLGSTIRNLWAWQDTNTNAWLAAGATASLNVINAGSLRTITPQTRTDTVALSVTTTSGSALVTISDTGSNISSYDAVYIGTQISVSNLVLYGFYPCIAASADTFQITATDIFGNPAFANSTVIGGGVLPQFTTTTGNSIVTVTLPNHGYFVGNTFPVYVPTTIGGITFSKNYIVLTVPTSNTFTIQTGTAATSSTSAYLNSGNAQYTIYHGIGPLPAGTGYGAGGFGTGGWGSGVAPVATTATAITTTDWALDNWGEILMSSPRGGGIYKWSPTANDVIATVVPNAPVVNNGIMVAMPQRQIIAWGSTFNGIQDPLLIRWSDVQDYTTWIATVTNQAGSFRIPKGSLIVGCLQTPQQGLVWTDISLWAMQYTGPPYVYGFNELASGCGMIAPKAAATLNSNVYWMGNSQFFMLGANGVVPVPCPIWDVIFQELDTSNLSKIRVAANSRFGEIAWYYPTIYTGSGEISNYAKYNVNLQQWDYGALQRTAWTNESALGPPIGADANGYIYQHEVSPDADGQVLNASFQTGYIALADADVKYFIDQIWPDMKWGYFGGAQSATILLTFYVTDYLGQTPKVYGPYTLTQATTFVTPRFRGRFVSIKIESQDIGSFWRIGAMRYRYQIDGRF